MDYRIAHIEELEVDMEIKSNFFTAEEISMLHDETVRVLTNVGIEFCEDKALDIFKENGFRVEGRRVYINEDNLNKALKSIKKTFILKGRTERDDVVVGNGKTIFAPGGGTVFVREGNERRSATSEDYENFLKLNQTSKVISIANPNMTEPQDMPVDERNIYRLVKCLEMTTKPLMGFTTGHDISRQCVKTIKKFRETENDHVVIGIISPLSPLSFDKSMIEGMMIYASENQPVIVTSCSLPGATSPVTMAGSLVTNNAEILAGIVFTQLVKPGLPVVYGGTTTACDMKTVAPAIGSPETGLFTNGFRALSEYYGLPCRSGGSLTDSKVPDMQAGMESTYSLLSGVMAGVDFMLHSCGILESFNVLSYEKFIIDEENISMAFRYISGFEISPTTIAYDAIVETGPQGNFMMNDHTFEHFRDDFHVPDIASRELFGNWDDAGGLRIDELARKIYKSRLDSYEVPLLTTDQNKILRDLYMQKIDIK